MVLAVEDVMLEHSLVLKTLVGTTLSPFTIDGACVCRESIDPSIPVDS